MKEAEVPYAYAGVPLGRFPAEVCQRCGETFFTEPGWLRIERLAREKGLWGAGSRVKVGYSGHSLILRIPGKLAAATDLKKGTTVYLQPAGKGKLLVERTSGT
ncbi:MAG: hypothetical protein HY520_04810 [Candidatus Aenigmarchaeota archaeon]|nr:hypothetical protein [Candidatus Aenigmarchaeota archaeon]